MSTKKLEKQPRVWQRMLSGRKLDLISPSPDEIEIDDIAHGLARVARWNGQTLGSSAFSVAQHSVIVEKVSGFLHPNLHPKWSLVILLHDSPEFVIGDLISPFKAVMGGEYRKIENSLQHAIHLRFTLPTNLPKYVKKLMKRSDKISAYYEAVKLAGFSENEAAEIIGRPGVSDFSHKLDFTPWTATKAQNQFLKRFKQLEVGISNQNNLKLPPL